MQLNVISGATVDAAIKVHSKLGPGLLESAYEFCLAHELTTRGFHVQRQVPVAIQYGAVRLDVGYRLDLLVNGSVVVEIKSVQKLHEIHSAQLLSHLRLSGLQLGILINFNVVHLRDGIKRMANRL